MAKINLNKLAKQITDKEGKRQQVNIAQVKEILKVTFHTLIMNYSPSEVMEVIERHAIKPKTLQTQVVMPRVEPMSEKQLKKVMKLSKKPTVKKKK